MFLFKYATDFIQSEVLDDRFKEITDFFELIEYAAKRKLEAAQQAPYVVDFIVRCYYAADRNTFGELDTVIQKMMEEVPPKYFGNVNCKKFEDGIDPKEIYDMLLWMTEGYICERRRAGEEIDLGRLMTLFQTWKERLKKVAYRKEYVGIEG